MGISSNCKIIVGKHYDELIDVIDDLDDLIDNGELDIGSVHYDSFRDHNVVGFEIRSGKIIQLNDEIQQEIDEAKSLFEKTYNIKPRVYVTLSIT